VARIAEHEINFGLEKTAVDRASGSGQPRYSAHAYARYTPPLPLTLTAPRRTPGRASSQMMKPSTPAINY